MTRDRNSKDPPQDGERLDSWKRLAQYLGRSERTVRRWEQDEGLPVHRLQHGSGISVYAYSQELDDWMEDRSDHPSPLETENTLPSLMVRRFLDLSVNQSHQDFCLGLTEELTSQLHRECAGLVDVRDWRSDPAPNARDHRVDFTIQGSVRSSTNLQKVTLHFIKHPEDGLIGSLDLYPKQENLILQEEKIALAAIAVFLPILRKTCD